MDYEDEYRPNLAMIKFLDNRTVEHLNAGILNEEYDLQDLHASLNTLDGSEVEQLTFYPSSNGLNALLHLLITKNDHLINTPRRFLETRGLNLLHRACIRGRCSTINLPLQHGAQIDAENCAGIRPLVATLARGREDAALLLLQRGARTTNPIPNNPSRVVD